MLNTGDVAPEFVLPDESGREVSLTSLLASGPLGLFFYPADFTPGCSAQVCSLRDAYDELRAAGLTLAGISGQGSESHDKFKRQHGLQFPLLADPSGATIRAYGAMSLGFLPRRVTYLIAPTRRIVARLVADLNFAAHRRFLHRAVSDFKASAGAAAAQPASMSPGAPR